MGFLTELLKKISPKLPKGSSFREIFTTSKVANAYLKNDLSKLGKLLKKGKSSYKRIIFRENNDYSLLHQAVADKNREIVDLVLAQSYSSEKDIIEDTKNTLGLAPVHLACFTNDIEILDNLIKNGNSSTDLTTAKEELSLLHLAAHSSDIHMLDHVHKNYFLKNLEVKNSEKWTPLHYTCFMNRMDATAYLVENGANLYSRNKQMLTPLETAVLNDNFDIFNALYNFHYDKKILDSFDHPEACKLVHIAASTRAGTRCLESLLDDPNNVNEICSSSIKGTPLHFACMKNNIAAVKVLLRKGANPNISDYLGNIPLMYATENANLPIIKVLIESGSDALRKNKEGLNSIEIALNQDNKDIKLYYMGIDRYKNYKHDFLSL